MLWVDKRQYYPAMKQLESYQASRQQNDFPHVPLEIINMDKHCMPLVLPEIEATEILEKSLLTGE